MSILLNSKHSLYLQEGAAAAGVIVLSIHLFPFFVHYFKENIDREQFMLAVKKFVPDVTTKTLNRIIMSFNIRKTNKTQLTTDEYKNLANFISNM